MQGTYTNAPRHCLLQLHHLHTELLASASLLSFALRHLQDPVKLVRHISHDVTYPDRVATILTVPSIVAFHFSHFSGSARALQHSCQTLYHSDMQTFRVCRGVAWSALPVRRFL